jgi:autotransporter translocation and assembly factor TamB
MRLLWLVHVITLVLRTVLWSVAFVLALTLSVSLHLQHPIARRVARDITMQFVNGEIRGELEIGRLDLLTLDAIEARFVTMRDGEGRKIIVADKVDLVPDFGKLSIGLIRFEVGRIHNATVRLVDQDGQPSLFTTFNPKQPSTGAGSPLRALVDEVELDDVTLYGQVIQLENVRVEHVHAKGRLAIAKDVEIELHSGSGQMVRPYDFVGHLSNIQGAISTDPVRGVKLALDGRRDDEDIHADLAYRSAAANMPSELQLELHTNKLTPDTLRRVGYAFAGPLDPPLSGDVQLSGPPEELSLNAQVECSAGAATVTGTISSTRGISVHVSSDAIQVDALVEQAPAVRARGLVHISVGPEENAIPEVHAEIGAMRYKGIRIPSFVMDGDLLDKGLRVEKARATQGGQLALRGYIGFDGSTDIHVNAQFAAVQRDPNLSLLAEDLEGSLATTLHIRMPPVDQPTYLDIEGTLELQNAAFGSLHASRVLVKGEAHGDPTLPKLNVEVHTEGTQVLEYHLGNARFTLDGGPNRYAARGEFEAQGQRTFSFDAEVLADRKGFVVQAEPIEFTVGTESWRGALRDLRVLHDESVELGYLRLGSRAQRMEAHGIMRVRGEDSLKADLQNFDVTALRAVLGERFALKFGYADASLELRGDVDKPELSITGALREGKLFELQSVDALYTVTYQDGKLELDTDVNLKEQGGLTLSGTGDLNKDEPDPIAALRGGRYDLKLTGSDLDASLLPQLQETLKGGKLNGSVNARGSLAAATLDGQLAAKDLRVLDWAALQVNTRFKYDRTNVDLNLSAKDAHGTLARTHTTWRVDWQALTSDPKGYLQRMLAEDFRVQGLTPARALDALPFPTPWESPVDLKIGTKFLLTRTAGKVDGEVKATLTPKQRLYDAGCQIAGDSRLTAVLQLGDLGADISFEALLNGSRVSQGKGKIEWPISSLLLGEAKREVPRIDLRGNAVIDHIERMPVLCRHGHGKLQADWSLLRAGRDDPQVAVKLQGELVPHMGAAEGVVSTPLERCARDPLQLTAELGGDRDKLAFSARTKGCSGGPAELDLLLPWHWNATVLTPVPDVSRDTTAKLNLRDAELEPVLDYLPSIRGFSAKANGQLTARVRQGKMNASGQLTLTGGRLYIIPTGQEVTDISLALTANGDWIKVDDMRANIGSGSLSAKGGIGFGGFTPNRMQLGTVLKSFPVQREGIDMAWLTGSAAIVTDFEPSRARTAVKLHSLAVRLPSTTGRTPQALEQHADIVLTTAAPKRVTEKPYTFEFLIDGRNQLTARRNDFEAALSMELAVSYGDPELRVGGYIEFRRGTFELFGKQFVLSRGSLQFDGEPELDPDVSMVAVHRPNLTGSSAVTVNVSGTLSHPAVGFYSDRCPGDGAVVLLVSGRCPNESDIAMTNPNATQNAFALGMLGGILTLGAQSQLSGLIPKIAVESGAQGRGTRVRAGFEVVPPFMRSLVQRVYVQGALSTGSNAGTTGNEPTTNQGLATPDFLIELYFPKNIVGSGRVAPTTRSWGVDVTWEP